MARPKRKLTESGDPLPKRAKRVKRSKKSKKPRKPRKSGKLDNISFIQRQHARQTNCTGKTIKRKAFTNKKGVHVRRTIMCRKKK